MSGVSRDSGKLNLLGLYGSVQALIIYDLQSGTNSLKIDGEGPE